MPKRLTIKQRRFVEEYCIDFNATRAAIRVGYSEKTAKEIGCRHLNNVNISRAILENFHKNGIKADELLKRLSDIGRASFACFLKISEGGSIEINLTSEEARANFHLIKSIKQIKRTIKTDGGPVESITFEIELHDPKDAIKTLLDVYSKFDGMKKGELTVNVSY